jgi:hypothetical protein
MAGEPSASLQPPLIAFSELVGDGRIASVTAVRTQTEKFIKGSDGEQREERFDLTKDPGEQVDLAGRDAASDGRLRSELAAWCAAWNAHGALARPVELDDDHRARLRALGYTE